MTFFGHINAERHKQKILKFKGRKVFIDADIAPMLQKMWKLGINTTNSCQAECSYDCKHKVKRSKDKRHGHDVEEYLPSKNCLKYVWIVFYKASDYEKFLNIVADFHDEDMYNLIRGRWSRNHNKQYSEMFKWKMQAYNDNYGELGSFKRRMLNGVRMTRPTWRTEDCHTNKFCLEVQLHFPREHISYIEEKLDKALIKSKKKAK